MLERRNYKRFIFENKIFLKFENDPTKSVEGELLDISFVGFSFFLKESVNANATVQGIVQFDAPFLVEHHLVGRGKVVYVLPDRLYEQKGFRIGLEFIEVDKEILLNSINQLRSKILDQIRIKSQMPPKDPGLF